MRICTGSSFPQPRKMILKEETCSVPEEGICEHVCHIGKVCRGKVFKTPCVCSDQVGCKVHNVCGGLTAVNPKQGVGP